MYFCFVNKTIYTNVFHRDDRHREEMYEQIKREKWVENELGDRDWHIYTIDAMHKIDN